EGVGGLLGVPALHPAAATATPGGRDAEERRHRLGGGQVDLVLVVPAVRRPGQGLAAARAADRPRGDEPPGDGLARRGRAGGRALGGAGAGAASGRPWGAAWRTVRPAACPPAGPHRARPAGGHSRPVGRRSGAAAAGRPPATRRSSAAPRSCRRFYTTD